VKEFRRIIPFTTAKKKSTRNKFDKRSEDLYKENYKSLKKEIEEHIRRWKDLPCSWILPKVIYTMI
jgi:hypothetical protein